MIFIHIMVLVIPAENVCLVVAHMKRETCCVGTMRVHNMITVSNSKKKRMDATVAITVRDIETFGEDHHEKFLTEILVLCFI